MPASTRSRSTTAPAERPAVATSVDAIRRILRALRLAARRTQVISGLSAAQLFVLRALEDGEEASLSQLAARTLTDRSSVAAVVDRLLSARLVIRGVASADRRRAAIVITAAGRAVLARAPEPPTVLLVTALRSLPEKQIRSLAGSLVALVTAMGVSDEPAGMMFDDEQPPVAARRRALRARRSRAG
jgi:DNA-binding MarR family transcriptional regulator